MIKRLTIKADNIIKCKDKKFVFYVYDQMIDSLFDFSNIISNLQFNKTDKEFTIKFDLKICHDGDILWILIKEWLSLIVETELTINVKIIETEDLNNFSIEYNLKYLKNDKY